MGRENLLGSRIRNDVDRLKMKLPQLFKTTDLETEHGWRWLMEDFVHIWFHIDDTYYFLFPEGAHRYGLSYYEASCITVGLFDTDSGVKRCEHGARSAECLQRAA